MSQLKTNAIRHTTATSDAITLASDGTATAKITNNLSNRNLIINGAMQVNQYGTSSTTASSRVCDRFRVGWGGTDEALTYSKHALTSSDTGPWEKGFKHSLHIQNGNQTSGAGTGDYASINYRTEAQDIVNSGWVHTSTSSYLTFSFWVKSSVAQNFYVVITNNDGTNYNYPVETGSLSANTWTKVTKTIPGNSNLTIDNDNGKGLEFDIQLFRGTDTTGSITLNQWAATDNNTRCPDMTSTWWTTNDATFEITGVQLEVGEVATDFEHRSYGDELARCQRYFWMVADGSLYTTKTIGVGFVFSSSSVKVAVMYPVTMRTEPALYQVTATDAYQVLQPGPTFDYPDEIASFAGRINMGEFELNDDVSGLTAGQACMVRGNAAAMRLGLNAEL